MRGFLHLAASLCLLASGAGAQEPRFQLERSGEAFIRLDRQTGEISRCTEQGKQMVCRTAADERAALLAELEDLRARIDALERRLAAMEKERPSADLPTEEEFEQSLGLMERFMRRFFGIIQDLERDTDPAPESGPDRT